jgi:DNA-binding SARP family transcriptional activator/TolB-like protein
VKTATLARVLDPSTKLRLLGGLEIEAARAPVTLPARKSEALLAVLALRPGVSHTRASLASLLWPDVPETQGRTSLRQALGHLRKVCSDELVQASADRLHLEPASVWVDTAELERVFARAALERTEAAELYRGELLAGFPALDDAFDRWLADERTRLRERTAARLEECLAALAAKRAWERALFVGERLVAIDPTREGVHRALMRIHLECADKPAALRQYERCRDALRRELDLKPSAETERLRQSVAAAAAAAGTGSSGPESEGPRSRAPSPLELAGRMPIAVLPFSVTSDAKEAERAELFAQALTDDVTTELSRFRELALVARTTLASLAPEARDPELIAAATGARVVLSGSVFYAGARVRVTAALVDTTTRLELWAERWEIGADEFLAVLDRLARSVVGALALRLDESRLAAARRRRPERLEVYECWLRGLDSLRQGTLESDDEGRRLFERALELSPTFARAYAGLSLSHFNDWSCQAWDRWELREKLAFEAASRAVELDESDHVTQVILARIRVYRHEFEPGERHVERAVTLNPNDANTLMHASVVYGQLGDGARACELADAAFALNPQHPAWYYASATFGRLVARQPAEALRLGSRAPDCLVDSRAMLAIAAAKLGDGALARDHAERFLAEFQKKIVPGREPEPGEPVRWYLRVNPLRRAEDVEYLLGGLREAGLG